MPLLPLPLGDTDIAGGDLPVSEPGDVLESFPRPQRDAAIAPVRDAFCDAFSLGFIAYQNAASYAAAQVDPLRATGSHLTAIAEDRGIPVGPSDTETTLRARIFAVPEIVTPDAIESAVNAILAGHTASVCHLSELNLDGFFIHGPTSVWDSFVGAEPNYPDRCYDVVPTTQPGGAVPSSGSPRSFALRIPLLAGASNQFTYASSNPESFVGDGTNTSGSEASGAIDYFTYANPQTSDDLYATIVGVVNSIKGQGISWSMLVDERL